MAQADTYTLTVANTTNGLAYTNTIPISGYIDKIEFSQGSAATSTVTVATTGENGVTVEQFLSLAATADDAKVVRPRVMGTTIAGVALAAVLADSGGTNVYSTTLHANYEKILAGGNISCVVTGLSHTLSDVQLTFYYEPVKK